MSRSGRPAGGTPAFISALLVILAPGTGADAEPSRCTNPVVRQRADPWVYRHTDGFYYFTASVPEFDRIELRRAATIQELGSSSPVVIWKKHDSGMASATDAHYCMGMLTASEDADLLDPGSWSKSATPVFQTDPAAGIYGPRHNSFTMDGDLDVLVYHARSYRDIAGDPLYDPNRDTRAQVLGWNTDGTPRFGTPQ